MFRDSFLAGVFDDHLPDGIGAGGCGESLPVADLLAALFFEGGELANGPLGSGRALDRQFVYLIRFGRILVGWQDGISLGLIDSAEIIATLFG